MEVRRDNRTTAECTVQAREHAQARGGRTPRDMAGAVWPVQVRSQGRPGTCSDMGGPPLVQGKSCEHSIITTGQVTPMRKPHTRHYRPRGRAWTSESGRRAAEVRWGKAHAEDAPTRLTETVEVVIRSSLRTQRTIRATRQESDDGKWGRWKVTDGGKVSARRWTSRALGIAVARGLG